METKLIAWREGKMTNLQTDKSPAETATVLTETWCGTGNI